MVAIAELREFYKFIYTPIGGSLRLKIIKYKKVYFYTLYSLLLATAKEFKKHFVIVSGAFNFL